MIKTLLFDLNNTIVTYKEHELDQEFRALYGVDEETFERIKRQHFSLYLLGELSLEELHRRALHVLRLDPALVKKSIALDEARYVWVDGMRELLETLAKTYTLILVAGDGKESLQFKLDHFSLRSYFSAIYCSCFEHLGKNDLRFYERILEKEKLAPAETILIDDHEEYGALVKTGGMHAITFSSAAQLRTAMDNVAKYL